MNQKERTEKKVKNSHLPEVREGRLTFRVGSRLRDGTWLVDSQEPRASNRVSLSLFLVRVTALKVGRVHGEDDHGIGVQTVWACPHVKFWAQRQKILRW